MAIADMRWTSWPGGLSVLIALASPAGAAPVLEIPIACDMRSVCSVQKYFDLDPGPERIDYACGRLTNDRHDGTDLRLPDFPAMDRGVAVIAAAPGVVKALRDGMPDISVKEGGAEAIKGKEAGNGVVIDHGDGWETQYGHMKQGSVAVRRGQQVEVGQTLGLVGLSGETEYPHVHFGVRYQGRSLDPFVGSAESFTCGDALRPLWSEAALAQIPYRPTGVLVTGFAADRPEPDAARRGAYAAAALPADAQALVFWADTWGVMQGDVQRFAIAGPDGQEVHRSESVVQKSNISWFAFSGKRRPEAGWAPGQYTGTYEIVRDGQPAASASGTVTIQ